MVVAVDGTAEFSEARLVPTLWPPVNHRESTFGREAARAAACDDGGDGAGQRSRRMRPRWLGTAGFDWKRILSVAATEAAAVAVAVAAAAVAVDAAAVAVAAAAVAAAD